MPIVGIVPIRACEYVNELVKRRKVLLDRRRDDHFFDQVIAGNVGGIDRTHARATFARFMRIGGDPFAPAL